MEYKCILEYIRLGLDLIKDANAARMATEEGQAAQRLAREKLSDRRMR